MSSLFGKVACIKASRHPESSPRLDWERVALNQGRGVQTQLLPDTNVIINMMKASSSEEPATDETLKKHSLFELVSFFRELSERRLNYYFSPFFCINELPSGEAVNSVTALNDFSEKFGINWVDAHPEVAPDLSRLGRKFKGYVSLDPNEQRWLAVPYASLLLALIVARDFSYCPPITKLRRFLRLYRRRIDIKSMREIAIALFIFAPEPQEGEEIYQVWDRIVRNFTGRKKLSAKLPTNPSQLDRVALNGAYDTALLNVANFGDARGIDGQQLDTWVVTGDLKLHALTEVVHHTGFGTREVGLALAIRDFSEFGQYWREAHFELNALGRSFRWDLEPSPDKQVQRALGVIALSELGHENVAQTRRYTLSARST